MDAVNVEEEYRSEIKEKSRGMGKKEGEQQQQQEEDELMQQQQQQQAEEPEPAPIMTMSSFESLLDDMDRLTSLGKKLTDSAARLHDLLGQESTNQEEINKIVSTLYHDANSSSQEQVGRKRPTTTTLETTVEAFLKEKMASIKHDVCSLEEELTHLEADKHDAVFDLNRKNEELERNKIRLRNLQHTRPSYMDEYESLEKELQKQYDLYMERYRNIHYLHHELKSVEKEEQALQDKIQKRTMELQTRLREEEQQMSNEMMLPNPKHPRNNDIPRATNNDDSPLVSSSNTAQPKHTAVLEKDHKETTNHDNTHDSSSGSSALIISQCSTEEEQLSNSGKESMLESPFSRTTSISVDSSTFFMNGPDFKSFVSPTSKSSLSGDESDDHF
jgi:DNA repair exonuclease SbcCD ATPase subunit